MAELTATVNAPKTAEDLRDLLVNDNKVKVAGRSCDWVALAMR